MRQPTPVSLPVAAQPKAFAEAALALRPLFAPARLQATTIQLLTVLMFGWAALSLENFASAGNIAAILYSASAVGVVAVGLAAVTIGGNLFALSLAPTAAFASILFAGMSQHGLAVACLGALGMGAAAGILQGVAVGLLRCNPIITSIAAGSIIGGIATLVSGGRTVLATGKTEWLGNGVLLPGLPYQALLFLLVVVLVEVLMQRTRAGRELRLRGTNPQAAELAGLRTRRVVLLSYFLCGLSAAAAGVLIAAQSGTGNMRVGGDLDFNAIAAVLVGGVAISGGRGRIVDAAVGALFLAVLTNILLVNNFSYEVQLMVKGLAVLAAVTAGSLLARLRR
ncbi:MAG TPA: ABC transporter permease [Burkholderiaceae bacterium]|nr:ABC transporter permease [Burkholderiaceae bacterium]